MFANNERSFMDWLTSIRTYKLEYRNHALERMLKWENAFKRRIV